ncbi:MAG: hypothetical protein ACI9ST_000875 [Psychrobacter glaciei]|jgi:hypothetical protein|uniref:DUF6161 domain-containing protein n=1 Tax=Psychrobacter glaciei TaxID=619771 RepID=UPI0039E67F3D
MDINDLSLNNPGKVQDREIDFSFKDATGEKFAFNTLYKLRDFIALERDFWTKIEDHLTAEDRMHIEEVVQGHAIRTAERPLLYSIISSGLYFKDLDENFKLKFVGLWIDNNHNEEVEVEEAISSIQQTFYSLQNESWVWSEHVFCKKGLEIFRAYGVVTASSFFEAFFEKPRFTNLSNLDAFKGALLSYEFQMQGESYLERRITLEEESIDELKERILNTRDNLYEELHSSKKKFKENSDVLMRDCNKQFSIWREEIESLEKTYKEKLRLEPAASYWSKKAEDYKKLGNRWAIILSVFVAVGLAIFGVLFYTWINAQTTTISIDSLQGVVLFITLLSVYAFAIKALSKLVFSSYHLQRDAEEREQLTYLYLSLTHEKDDFDTDARSIVLQALFSRADTGLISGDSSPTMPGVHEIINASSNR